MRHTPRVDLHFDFDSQWNATRAIDFSGRTPENAWSSPLGVGRPHGSFPKLNDVMEGGRWPNAML